MPTTQAVSSERVRDEPPLIGRDDELEMFQHVFARALRQGSAELVTLTGEQGLGKSRLVQQFLRWSEQGSIPARWLLGRCQPYRQGLAYWALAEMVKSWAAILDSDSPDEAANKLRHALERVSAGSEEGDWLAARLAPLVGATDARPEEDVERGEWFAAWRLFFEHIAAEHPLVLVFEDLHWADPTLLEFVEHLLDWSTGAPIVVVCTADPELFERSSWWGGGKRSSTTIVLSPLTEEETARLLEALAPASRLPSGTRSLLIERSGGNPLYAEQFVRMLADRGTSTVDPDLPVPDSVRSLILLRLAGLSDERRGVLGDAAVMGRTFWAGAVAAIGRVDRDEVSDSLHELARTDLIRSSRASSIRDEMEYSFHHALVRDVAYADLAPSARWVKHRAAAGWIEDREGDRSGDDAGILAEHYLRALDDARAAGGVAPEDIDELADRAARNLETAGDRAAQLDVAKAGAHFRRALELLGPDAPERAGLLAKAAETSYLSGDFPTAVAEYEQAIAGLRAAGDSPAAGKAMLDYAYALWNQGWTGPSRELLGQAVALLEGEPPGRELAQAYAQAAGDLFFGGRSRESLEWCQKALALATPFEMKEVVVRVLEIRGMARCDLRDWDGLEDLREALRRALDLGLGQEAVRAFMNLGTFVTFVEGPAKALELYRQGIDLAERRGVALLGMWTKAWSCGVLFELGRWDELVSTVREVVAWERSRGRTQFVVGALLCEAEVRLYRGEIERAVELVGEFLPRARDIQDPQVLVPALAVAALVREGQGDLDGAVELIRELDQASEHAAAWTRMLFLQVAVRLVAQAGRVDLAEQLVEGADAKTPREDGTVVTARASLAEARGETEEAAKRYAQAADIWARYGFELEEGRALLGAGRTLLALGRASEAEPVLRAADELFQGLRAGGLEAETLGLLSLAAVDQS